MKKILLITTGGTIASSQTKDGFAPSASGEELLAHIPEIKGIYDIHILPIMQIDSTNMSPSFMAEIGATIKKYYGNFDAFVIAHGTDTMAYTASFLTYMLKNLSKAVVLTGSQIAMGEEGSDAPKNMRDAFKLASDDMAGVYIAFGGKAIEGTKAVKARTHSFEGFESINADNIAFIDKEKINYTAYGKQVKGRLPLGDFKCLSSFSDEVAVIKLTPGMPKEIIKSVASHCKAIVIEAFGMGGVPFLSPNLQDEVLAIKAQGKLIVIASQCLYEETDISVYEVGVRMEKAGILSAKEMTTEAVVMKLMWSLGNSKDIAEAESLFLSA